MKHFYLIVFLATLLLSPSEMLAQDGKSPKSGDAIEQVGFYPNPVTDGKLYFTGKSSMSRDITIFDILGKVVLQSTISSKELNISSLQPGVYMIRIKEGEQQATRKLVIR